MDGAESIGDYELLEEIGSGAAGAVFRARHSGSGEVVALKVLHAQTAGDMELQQRFVREVGVLQRLHHPKIVRHRDCGIENDKLFLAMEFVDSGTLQDVLKSQGLLPWRVATGVALQICEALTHAHAQGVIHRDLKPANLFLSSTGDVKVGDFGLARDLARNRLTIEGQTVGTCKYMAPEQVQGKADLTGAVDLYALGCLMFQMLTGKPPFEGATVIEVFEKHLFTEPPNLQALAPDTPKTLSSVVEKLLAKSPVDRPADAATTRAMLQAALEGQPLPQAQQSTDLAEQVDESKPTVVTRNQKMTALALAVLGGIGLLLWLFIGQS